MLFVAADDDEDDGRLSVSCFEDKLCISWQRFQVGVRERSRITHAGPRFSGVVAAGALQANEPDLWRLSRFIFFAILCFPSFSLFVLPECEQLPFFRALKTKLVSLVGCMCAYFHVCA